MFDLSTSIADYGAQRTLGMGGSLTRYINTGSAYPALKSKKSNSDEYVGKKSKKRFDKLITVVSLAAAATLALFGLNKKFLIYKALNRKYPIHHVIFLFQ